MRTKNMINEFDNILRHYKNNAIRVNSSTDVYNDLVRKLPKEIGNLLNRNDVSIRGSMGMGNKTPYPWISILNKQVTNSTQEGLYIVYLFKRDMSGFYLTLDQGITNLERLYGRNKYKYAQKIAEYFKKEIGVDLFSKDEISLGSFKGDIGYGYEKTAIIAKEYKKDHLSESELSNDLVEMMKIYDEIIAHMQSKSYNQLIKDIIEFESEAEIKASDAINEIENALEGEMNKPYVSVHLIERIPYEDRSSKFERITKPIIRKVDYIKKAAKDAEIGYNGEKMALIYERDKLIELGREDLAEKVRWVSREGDGHGYDIESFDIDDFGNVTPLKVEVKTTSSHVDIEFLVSVNEKNTSDKLGRKYCVFRIYDAESSTPKFYRVKGKIEDNFFLDPITYAAYFKGAKALGIMQ